MHFYLGDTPGAVSVVPASVQDWTGLTDADATLTSPTGAVEVVAAVIAGEVVTISLPVLEELGVYSLRIVLSGLSRTVSLAALSIPVEAVVSEGWHTLDSARREWQGAPVDDAVLYDLLVSAREQVLAFAPAVVGVPVRYRQAQVMQARNSWNAHQRNQGSPDAYGSEGFVVTVHPLDWHIRQLLRPATAVPVVG